ncbi:pyridoxal phosphate-dependent aminotransferase [Marispirochaeta sp.]|jgi:alanine-synthesizing transaminase|uniref:pyridoxal phosphate-dependent aminotransferase n=1 Tax=Marispirochaeta sp. TaxID=2038653 RepID=UPI0029C8AC3E|nr:pyridoxal phosphate-dependent aminotransferase [Marispirochaeta sp.]
MKEIRKSRKLDDVCYDIRGPVLSEAQRLEEEGFHVMKLNTGNPYAFGFNAPDELLHDVVLNLHEAQGYIDSKGLFPARKAVMQYCQQIGIDGVGIEDIYIGNGVSELITMAMQGLLDSGDEVLIPSPDYPLWTAAATLSGGKAVHYRCDEESSWYPDIADIASRITDRTRGIVIINPNNPTGSVYPKEILEQIVELARQHDLIVFSDEIYDKILYDDTVHTPTASLADDILMVTFNGLSKVYRAAGFRAGWMIISGRKSHAEDYLEGLSMLSNMRLCANVPAQYAIQAALGGYQSIKDLLLPGGRLREQRDIAYRMLTEIPGITCVKPQGALYLFPKIDTDRFGIVDDMKFILDFLKEKKVLMVQGTGFNWPDPDHFRIVFLPRVDELEYVLGALQDFLETYRQV